MEEIRNSLLKDEYRVHWDSMWISASGSEMTFLLQEVLQTINVTMAYQTMSQWKVSQEALALKEIVERFLTNANA